MMEYVDGVNLRQALRAGRLTPEEALRIVPQLCDALQFAHDQGVVHRDIKPENILLDKRGRVKVADFGLAKMLAQSAGDLSLTSTRQVMGTMHYMAPEQLAGTKAVDHRADIYSLGVTFYELLTGELPLGRFPPPSQTAGIDARLDPVVLRTLELEPAHRYQHASDVKTEVESILRESSNPRSRNPTPPPSQIRLAGNWLIAAGVVVVLMTVGIPAALLAPDLQNDLKAVLAFQLVWSLVAGAVVMWAGVALRRLRGYRWALVGAILAIVPITPAVVIGLPVGVWVLWLLRRRDVRAEFQRSEWLAKNREFGSSLSAAGRDKSETAIRALGWLVGRFLRGIAWTRVVTVLLCLIGASTLLGKWVHVQIDARLENPPHFLSGRMAMFTVAGHELWQGWATGLGFFVVAGVALATVRVRAVWPAVLLLLGGAACGLAATVVLVELPVPEDGPELRRVVRDVHAIFPQAGVGLLPRTAWQILLAASREHNIEIREHVEHAAVVALLVAAALVLLAVVDLSRSLARADAPA